ncbi:MAG: O-antigen ligase domain-containing protein [Microcystis viridis Mv_BB_P_19951000_S69]|uniref:O-antigen ligase domain-containing protein n=1 Tax=Microcystis viridis Mv_BB_P_19951000_S68D TaxID=2486270 RepID=A0A552I2W7_MICVR|nr:MAG: O-antigen ligase domain-containing protein [Microcystis viridis Mv_BB_P_19951000_S68]TRU76146.1 MAG: O-antigen ligase domain-containing protein [Microcystis viridis Mv_BB_P_19951000_S69]TRU77825.1 MAG: O-antigen ligase domain-containing protein [Microcystis viridis Mv_BB_P_19951000_S68D]TRU80423.1 MAG: O-antigen ligase domain-containing protein [Microcystis viridis Mv_BB_P_19951000_S69D]
MTETTNDIATSRLWLLLTAFLYAIFTLMADSHSLMVQWPWVAIWQIGLLCPILWLLSQIWHHKSLTGLGNGFDLITGIIVLGLIISSLFSPFPNQARWYSWAAIGIICALYALHQWIITDNSPQRRYAILSFQGYLSMAFIIISLFLWTSQTLSPELARIRELQQNGVEISFDFSVLELRNWAPLGHQNYVAGFLVLALPLLLGLAILAKNWQRWLWFTGLGLGILDLYTTSSRGGWLGLIGVCVVGLGILIFRSQIPRLWLGLGGLATLLFLLLVIFANNRLKTVITSLVQGGGDNEFSYRWINTLIGGQMGSENFWTGIGLGNVPITYQHYRPLIAGRASELIYQLHSTPAQLFAELGIWGILAGIGLVTLLIFHFFRSPAPDNFSDQILLPCVYTGLFGYGLMSLTDYQLDNIAIAGTLTIYLACLTSSLPRKETKFVAIPPKVIFFTGLGIVLVMIIWLLPIHRAWQLSSYGFDFLAEKKIAPFRDTLIKAHQLAPWEPYYTYQLGWNLGDLAINTNNPQALNEGIKYFQVGNQVSPYQEFGHSNLGWLQLRQNPSAASKSFIESIKLIPAKRGVFQGLAVSLLAQNQSDLAIEAFALEAVRDPLFITSPLWRLPSLQPIYTKMLDRVDSIYSQLLQSKPSENLKNNLHFYRGSLSWWRGDKLKAAQDWQKSGGEVGKALLNPSLKNPLPGVDLLKQAWLNPPERGKLLAQAWLQSQKSFLPTEIEKNLADSMAKSANFDLWLREKATPWLYRRQRAGFGVNSRHIDGVQPFDFTPVVDNIAVTTWFNNLFATPDYFPEFDTLLQPLREELIKKVQG